MPRRWTTKEESIYRKELVRLYVSENKSIAEIAELINISEKSVYKRLLRLDIPINREGKLRYNNQRNDIRIPNESVRLAEFLGIMLGDGHVAHFQTFVTLGTKEFEYVLYVQSLMEELFGARATIRTDEKGYNNVYIGSVEITKWLKSQGLVQNKVKAQVGVPEWIFTGESYMIAFVRGFFDTDGSVYKLRFGIQISITNHSVPLLIALQYMLRTLGYSVSKLSAHCIYITRKKEVIRFFEEIAPMNTKHQVRYESFIA